MFERIDKEEDGEVYVKEVVDYLRVLDDNMEQTKEVHKYTNNTKRRQFKLLYLNFKCILEGHILPLNVL